MKAPAKPLFSVIAVCLCALYAGAGAAAEELNYVFRGNRWDEKLFHVTGPNTLRALRVDSGGLRITLSNDRKSSVPVGLCTRFGVRGDFEITMTFEILQIEKPASGNGAGASIYISSASSTQDTAGVARIIRSDGKQVFHAFGAKTPEGQKRRYYRGNPLLNETRTGKLRLVRKGSELTYLVAPSPTAPFQELHKVEWVSDDLDIVRIAAENGGSPALVDVQIKDIKIRANSFGAATSARRPSGGATIWWTGGALLVAAAGVGYWWWQRRSGR